MNILLIDPDPQTRAIFDLIGELLPECRLVTEPDFARARAWFSQDFIHLLMLDLTATDSQQLVSLRQEPHLASAYRIYLVTEGVGLLDRLRAYHLQGQDLILKPFVIEEVLLLLRSKLGFLAHWFLNAQQRQPAEQNVKGPELEKGDFLLNHLHRRINCRGIPLSLTRMEYSLLKFLIEHSEEVLTPEVLIGKVWSDKYAHYLINDSNLRSLVYKLRQKLEPRPTKPVYLLNSRHSGYVFFPAGGAETANSETN